MTTPNTRSVYGATYVPIDWNNKEDPGSDSFRASDTQKFLAKRVYDKGSILAKLFDDRTRSKMGINAFRQKYLDAESSSLSDEEKKCHLKLLELAKRYSEFGSYQEIVSSLQDIENKTLTDFIKNWLDVEKDLYVKALDDWKMSAEEEIKTEEQPETQKKIVKEIDEFRTDVEKHFLILSKEITGLRDAIASKERTTNEETVAPSLEMTHSRSKLRSATARSKETVVEEPKLVAEPKMISLPKAKILGRMWRNEERRESAKFLGSFLFTSEKMSHKFSEMGMAASQADMLDFVIVDQPLIIEAVLTKYEIIKRMIEELSIEPVGYLYLERLDFTPIGYVKGELVYSLPLTPGEKITVSHKEWSNTTEEYVKEVEMAYEEEREKSLSENTELTESSKSEKQFEQKVEASVEASYNAAPWSIVTKGGYSAKWNEAKATERSSKRSQEITSKAASRSKKEHKMSFRVAREVHVEDEQVRVIENKSDKPVRWDFHRLMKKWKIELYHIPELRLTYDIVVPEPADYLLRKYVELKNIQKQIDEGSPFDLSPILINEHNYFSLGSRWRVELESPPQSIWQSFTDKVERHDDKTYKGIRTVNIEFSEEYEISEIRVLEPAFEHSPPGALIPGDMFYNYDNREEHSADLLSFNAWYDSNMYRFEESSPRNTFPWRWGFHFGKNVSSKFPQVILDVKAVPTDEAINKWRMECFTKLSEAARARWITTLEGLQNQRDRLIEELTGKDSLKLRQMEKEEIMKAVLRWMLGPGFEFYPSALIDTTENITQETPSELDYYEERTGRLREEMRNNMFQHGKLVRFLQQAIEWENVNWVMYPYFWTRPGRWDFKQSLDHPDFYHRNFLRGGCARVVLTIRQGFEEDWLALMEGLDALPDDHPYLTLATEIKNHAHENFPYTPDPNREELIQIGILQDTWYEYSPTGALDIQEGEELLDQ
jgi:hypothetical protein